MANLNRPSASSSYPGQAQPAYGSQQPYGSQQGGYSQPPQAAYSQPPQGSNYPPSGQPPYNPSSAGGPYGQQGGSYPGQQGPYGQQGGAAQPPYASAPGGYGAPSSMASSYGQPGGGAGPFNMATQSQPGYGSSPYPQQTPYSNPPPSQYPQQQNMGGMGGMPPQMGGMGGMPMGANILQKGGNFSLSKAIPGLRQIRVGLGWDVRQTGGPAFDLDASCFLLKGDGRVRMPQDFVFYNNKQSVDGSVFHHGDNLTGAGEGDDESISIDLSRVPPEIQRITFTVSIYDAEVRRQNFGMISRAFIRVIDSNTQQEICRFDLSEEASLFNSMIFGEVYRYGGEWKFRAIGQGLQGGLRAIGGMYGLNLQ
eukprot:TRINITY_DN123_c0_g1_i1.p1 TRINITY_DN123_c0_g1~~TRINITY_DN123_c0_g1_i1.p1  ORF type:complete len:366 (+),score=140.72 TRINITY_DN123_c0_g1_i1:109-1206(+)